MSDATPTVFVVDDDVSVRESLEALLASAGFRVETFGSARDFLSGARRDAAGCLVLDVSLPDLDGLEVQERVTREEVALPIIFITGFGDVPMTVRAMKAGAIEFLTKPLDDEVLLRAVHGALGRGHAERLEQVAIAGLRVRYRSLTRRERDVMALVVSGLPNKQVGSELGIREVTVKAHRGQVMRKMNAASFADLVQMAIKLGAAAKPPRAR